MTSNQREYKHINQFRHVCSVHLWRNKSYNTTISCLLLQLLNALISEFQVKVSAVYSVCASQCHWDNLQSEGWISGHIHVLWNSPHSNKIMGYILADWVTWAIVANNKFLSTFDKWARFNKTYGIWKVIEHILAFLYSSHFFRLGQILKNNIYFRACT